MKGLKGISIVMIAYNEESHIEKVIKEYYSGIFVKLKDSEFILYLDSPTDNTVSIVKNLAQKLKIRVIEGKTNLGYAGAMTKALAASKKDIIFYSDSSGKHQARDFWRLIKFEDKFDIVTGLRVSQGDPLIRRVVTYLQRILVSILFFIPFHDFNTGYKIIHRKVITDVLPHCRYMKQSFSSELLIRAHKKGFTIKDVPVAFKKRVGSSKGTNYIQLPSIIFRSLRGFLLLRIEMFRRS